MTLHTYMYIIVGIMQKVHAETCLVQEKGGNEVPGQRRLAATLGDS